MTNVNNTTITTSVQADAESNEAVTPVTVETPDAEAVPLNHVELKIAAFRERMLSDNSTLMGFQVQGWAVLWDQIAAAYSLGKVVLDPANKADFDAALENCGIKVVKSSNPWVLATKLMYGEWKVEEGQTLAPWDSAANSIFELDRSAEKYSTYFRYFEAKKVNEADVFEFIKGFDGHLKGIEREFRAMSSSTSSGLNDNDAVTLGSRVDLADVVSLPAPANIKDGMGSAFFKVENGKIHLLGITELTEEQFDAKAKARGKKLFAANRKAVETKAAVQAVANMLTKKAA